MIDNVLGISSYTTTSFFPAEESINQLILSYSPFKDAIRNITVPENAEDDELSGIAGAIVRAWSGMEKRNVSLKQIVDAVRSIGKGYMNIKTYPNAIISEDCKEVFHRCGLCFHISGITQEIYIVAPVVYKDAKISLEKEFPASISKKFRFLTFAIDTVKDAEKGVIPGVGGMVYPKLGLGDSHEKNKYIPNLVKERAML